MDVTARQRAFKAYALCPEPLFAERYERLAQAAPAATTIRGPEIGAVMLRGRMGGGGAPFNLGEASVTRATVKLPCGQFGHAFLLGRQPARAVCNAHLDALWQMPEWHDAVEVQIVAPALAAHAAAAAEERAETEATRVDFFTMVRGEDE